MTIAHKGSEDARSVLCAATYINHNKHLKIFPIFWIDFRVALPLNIPP